MFAIIAILLLLFAASAGRLAQALDASVPGDHLYGVSFLTPQFGWAAGAFGIIVHTTDGGRTWTHQSSGTKEPLFGIDFVDKHYGWVVGRSGVILHTRDGGKTWVRQPSGFTDKHLLDIDFVDARFGCAVGDWGIIVCSEDGGGTWEDASWPQDVILNDVFFLNATTGWIVGELGIVLFTADGGKTWKELPNRIGKSLFGVHFKDATNGWAVGMDALILRTSDAGNSWQVLNGTAEPSLLDQVGFAQAYDHPSLYSIAIEGNTGVAVGDIGAVFTSSDGGASWSRMSVPDEWGLGWFRSVSLVHGAHGMIVGSGGLHVAIVDSQIVLPKRSLD